jgi:serine/threonine-protein kinase
MKIHKLPLLGSLVLAAIALHGYPGSIHAQEGKADDLAVKAEAILKKHCAECHSKKIKKPKGDLDLWNPKDTGDAERKILVPGKPETSEMIRRLRPEDKNEVMPPKKPLGEADVRLLTAWVKAGGKYPGAAVTRAGEEKPAQNREEANAKNNKPPRKDGVVNAAPNADLAAKVKEMFRARCFACHGGSRGTEGSVKILDHESLLKKRKIAPGNVEGSKLFRLITANDDSVMPPKTEQRLESSDTDLVRQWISAGAPAWPADAAIPVEKEREDVFKNYRGVDYVLKNMLEHVRHQDEADRPFIRYLSINHILMNGATPAELDLQRNALAKAVNHMTWEKEIVRLSKVRDGRARDGFLEPIDPPTNSVYAVDLRKLGWNEMPFKRYSPKNPKTPYVSYYNRYDLVTLEYPYGIYYQDSDTFERLVREYLSYVKMARPVPYVRADWFCSAVTQPPMYEDMLDLPLNAKTLEHRLKVYVEDNIRDYKARRSGMALSGVSRNNRVVEHHPALYGSYWKSYDFKSSKGSENMFKDPIYLNETGGEFIFTMPNGLQGYYVANAKGERLQEAPTEIVTDKFASDKVVRNGLACMRCHDQGMKPCTDSVRPAIERMPGSLNFDTRVARRLYVPQKEFDHYLERDGTSFMRNMEVVLGGPQKEEPLIPVSRRYLDDPLTLPNAAGELGYAEDRGLEPIFRTRDFTALGLVPLSAPGGKIRRDAWEDYYDQAVRALGVGIPLVPIDGVTRRDYLAPPVSHYVELKTNKKGNTFAPGDKMVITVKNKSDRTIYIELFGTGTKGNREFVTYGVLSVKPKGEYRFPDKGALTVKANLGKESITMYASYKYFPPGEIYRSKYDVERIIHPFYQVDVRGRRPRMLYDAYDVCKKTIDIETK